ncbi:MAG: hypothetical protein ABSG82_00145 [Sedimentisphaerales bacterium]|jgi:hypothetical protein
MMFLVRGQLFVVRSSLLVLVFAFGCQSHGTAEKPSPLQQVEQFSAQKAELQNNLEKSQIENGRLKKQIDTLSNLPGDKKAESLYQLQAVKIGRYTNLYDEDKNGRKETLIVYVQPVDETGDVIKAAGAVDVQLWDLNKKESESLLAQWRIEPNELKKMWLNSMFSGNYRLAFDFPALAEKSNRALTIKVTFTDYLSGQTFTEQKAIKP